MTPRAETIARMVLDAGAAVFYVAVNETQRRKAVEQAARVLEPLLREIEKEAAKSASLNASQE